MSRAILSRKQVELLPPPSMRGHERAGHLFKISFSELATRRTHGRSVYTRFRWHCIC